MASRDCYPVVTVPLGDRQAPVPTLAAFSAGTAIPRLKACLQELNVSSCIPGMACIGVYSRSTRSPSMGRMAPRKNALAPSVITAAMAGDRAAFEMIYLQYRNMVFAVCQRLV